MDTQIIIMNITSSYKCRLVRGNQIIKNQLDPISQEFSKNPIIHITWQDRSKIIDKRYITLFRNNFFLK